MCERGFQCYLHPTHTTMRYILQIFLSSNNVTLTVLQNEIIFSDYWSKSGGKNFK